MMFLWFWMWMTVITVPWCIWYDWKFENKNEVTPSRIIGAFFAALVWPVCWGIIIKRVSAGWFNKTLFDLDKFTNKLEEDE